LSNLRVGFCVSGAGRLFQDACSKSERIGIEIDHLVLDTAAPSNTERVARSMGVRVTRLQTADRADVQRQVAAAMRSNPCDVYALTFDRILSAEALASHPGRVINVHPALLPAFRGTAAMRHAIEQGVRFSGATIHEVDELVDHGAIISQCVVPIDPADDVEALGRKMWALLRPMFCQTLRWYAEGRVEHDAAGRVLIRGASYGELPVSPRLERSWD
jgi:phosphoribosylglycinamide formyltransferase-1